MFRTCIIDLTKELVINIIDYETEQTETPLGFSDTYLCIPSENGQIGDKYINGEIIKSPNQNILPTAEQNKQNAINLLFFSDWATIPDISNPTISNPYLINKNEFIIYRNIIRAIAINPTDGLITFPTIPKAVWSF
jgi:hypothetical protein